MEPQMTVPPMYGRATEGTPMPVTPNVPAGNETGPPPPFAPYQAAVGTQAAPANPPRQRSYRRSGEWRW